jgi:hypothetical protein
MDVFTSLMTPGYLVRTPKGRHGFVEAFDTHTNMVTVRTGDFSDSYHVIALRAGNADSVIAVIGRDPKGEIFPYEGIALQPNERARSIPHPRNSRLDDTGVVGP